MMSSKRGFIAWIVILFIALVLLKFFLNWDIFDAAASPEGQNTIGYARNLINLIWSYIGAPVVFIWERIVWPVLSLAWDNFQALLEKGRNLDLPTVGLPSA